MKRKSAALLVLPFSACILSGCTAEEAQGKILEVHHVVEDSASKHWEHGVALVQKLWHKIIGDYDQVHIHTYVWHRAVAATAETDGNKEYYSCTSCDEVFDAKKVPTTWENIFIPRG